MKCEKVTCRVCGEKSSFPVLRKAYPPEMEKYPRFCPNPETLVELEMDGIIQECKHCGYTFPRIDEDTRIEKKMVKTRVYKHPFTAKYNGPKEAEQCYRIAMTCHETESVRTSAQWFIYAAVLLGDKYEEEQKKCYKNALMLLEAEIRRTYVPKNIELYLAYLNVMRLLEMFECVKEFGQEMRYRYKQLDRRLIETIIWLAEQKNSEYITYFDMLFLDIKEG